jgi:hypothetical protein
MEPGPDALTSAIGRSILPCVEVKADSGRESVKSARNVLETDGAGASACAAGHGLRHDISQVLEGRVRRGLVPKLGLHERRSARA